MELVSRAKNDRYARPGRYTEVERRLRDHPEVGDISALVAYAFDFRTRLGPFLFADTGLLTAGPRAVAAALVNSGFKNTRVVMRQWNPNFKTSRARLDGAPPQMLLVSSMQIHSASAYEMITDAHKLGDEDRPLILAGGAKAIYEPWDFFNVPLPAGERGRREGERRCSADAVVTGEELVLLELLDRIMAFKAPGEHMRKTFHRLRVSGLLDDIPGLVFREGDDRDPLGKLVNTGMQRLVQDLDELPHPIHALDRIEAPHTRQTLTRRPVPLDRLHRHATILALVTTHGCKFHCPYCPIPAYNQFTFRYKSPDRLRDEIQVLAERTGISMFFGTDDNFFNSRDTVEDVFNGLSKGTVHGKPFRDNVFIGTEATEFDVFKNQDLLPLCREGGLRAIWFGIEDMTAELVKKGQSPEKTKKLFEVLTRIGICPMPMMMHHDGQPLYSKGNLYGLLNQVNFLRKSGCVTVQVTILTPSVGSKGYEEPYEKGMVLDEVAGEKVLDYQYDGNHCVATEDPRPWRKQVNIMAAYASFYNPLNFLRVLMKWKDPLWSIRVCYQLMGMLGLLISLLHTSRWMFNLWRGPVKKRKSVPQRKLDMIETATTGNEQKPQPAVQYQSV